MESEEECSYGLGVTAGMISPSPFTACTREHAAYHATCFSLTITSLRLHADRIGDSASNLDFALWGSGRPYGESVRITWVSVAYK